MGEYIGASIRLSGPLRQVYVQDLIEVLNAYDLTVDFDGEKPSAENLHKVFGNWEVNYGNLEEIEGFAQRRGLDYELWNASGPDWDASTYRMVGGERREITMAEQGPVLTEGEIDRLGSMAAIKNWFFWWKQPLPDLQIVP